MTVCWHRANLSQRHPYNARHLAGQLLEYLLLSNNSNNNNNNDDDDDGGEDDDDDDGNNNNENNNDNNNNDDDDDDDDDDDNKIIAFKNAIQNSAQSPHCLQHFRSSEAGAIVCKSCATYRALFMSCYMSWNGIYFSFILLAEP